jgi:SAM-dependent methyltransferase
MFGDNWRKQGPEYWDAMAARCADLPFNDLLIGEVLACRSLIEIGCGGGHLAQALATAGYRGTYWGCDISPAAVQAARARLGPDAIVAVGQFEQLSWMGAVPRAELVIARSVIQHQQHWLPLVDAALRHAPRVVLGISRAIYFKANGEHDVQKRGSFYDVCISLEAMEREASQLGIACSFRHVDGRRGPEVVIALARA